MPTLKLEIVTPEAKIFSDDVDIVYVPGVEGELGILPRHIPLMTMIKPGELRVTAHGKETFMAVDETAAEAAVKRAQEALHAPHINDEEVASVQAALQKSLAQLHVKRRHHL